MREVKVEQKTEEHFIDLAIDTLDKNKQALVFVNSKRSAEKCAEEIAKTIKIEKEEHLRLSEKLLNVLSKPTKQCERLAKCVRKGIVFHHAGLHAEQKEIIEDAFREGVIRIICCTPTLAAGLDLPAFRVILKDLKRYAEYRGLTYIPVLEYLQMAGRAGRPKFDVFGEAIAIASTENESDVIFEKYVRGEPEEIYSKLAVEPVLRIYLLSLISSEVVQTQKQIEEFFSKTFWAHQFKNVDKLNDIIHKVLNLLICWEFVLVNEQGYFATLIGKRVAQLYVDPLTANNFISALKKTSTTEIKPISWIQLVSNTLEMRPLLRVKAKEYETLQNNLLACCAHLLQKEPDSFDPDYEDYLNAFKTSTMLNDWIEEKDEEMLLENYDVRPGETRVKLKTADWLLYALCELAALLQQHNMIKEIAKTRMRIQYGVKEELLALLRLEGVGRVRARKLFNNKIKDLGDVRSTTLEQLSLIVGKKIAQDIKQQAGENN